MLHAAKLGDAELIKDLMDNDAQSEKMNVNCVDYMGRNALFLAVDTENIDAIGKDDDVAVRERNRPTQKKEKRAFAERPIP